MSKARIRRRFLAHQWAAVREATLTGQVPRWRPAMSRVDEQMWRVTGNRSWDPLPWWSFRDWKCR